MKRILWEVGIVLVLLAAIFGLWKWSEINAERAVGEQVQRGQAELARVREDCNAWVANLADDQAEAVFMAFAAGIQSSVLAGRTDALAEAKTQLLHLPEILFVHVLAPDGTVLLSSDEKLNTTGRADERAAWALAAQELTRHPGERPGSVELAAPILGTDGPQAILWIGYHTERLKERTRPEGRSAP